MSSTALAQLLADVHGRDLLVAAAGELQQVGDQVAHAFRLLLDDLQGRRRGSSAGVRARTDSIRRLTVARGLFSSWAMLAANSPTLASLAACHSCWRHGPDFLVLRLQLRHGLLQSSLLCRSACLRPLAAR